MQEIMVDECALHFALEYACKKKTTTVPGSENSHETGLFLDEACDEI